MGGTIKYVIPDDVYLNEIISNKNFKVIVARSDNQIIGGLTGYILYGYDIPKPFFYIYDLGVDKNFQNMGVGKKLIEHIRGFAKENKFYEVFVGTELCDNEDALNFYQRTPIDEQMQVMQFSYRM